MLERLALFVISRLLKKYVGSDLPNSNQIVDGCLAIKEGLLDE